MIFTHLRGNLGLFVVTVKFLVASLWQEFKSFWKKYMTQNITFCSYCSAERICVQTIYF